MMPTLLLQPLVENAVKHGIAPRASGGFVRIVARAREARLRLVVEDSGRRLRCRRRRDGRGVGLRSVGDRLRAHYGADASVRITSAAGSRHRGRDRPAGRHPVAHARRQAG